MGTVLLAVHRVLRTQVVVKVLRATHRDDAAMGDRLRLEAQAAAGLRHPNIIAVSDFGWTPAGRPYLVMEHLEGQTLRQEVEARGPLPVAEAIGLMLQMLAGLAEAHRAGIVHRDLKPDNLFLCNPVRGEARVLKILDFGIAKVTASADPQRAPAPLAQPTAEGMAIGTPRFLAPEQALGRPIDHRADLYAAGGVLYWLLVGHDPFHHHNGVFPVIHAHVTEAPAPPSLAAEQAIPPELDALILRCLEKQRARRPASAESLAAELRAILAGASKPARWAHTEPLDVTGFRAPGAGSTPAARSADPDPDATTLPTTPRAPRPPIRLDAPDKRSVEHALLHFPWPQRTACLATLLLMAALAAGIVFVALCVRAPLP